MKKNDWKKREGVVYSTDSNFTFEKASNQEVPTLTPDKQQLKVFIDRSGRAGKQVTIVSGFEGTEGDLDGLCRQLKTRYGTGGSVKHGEILIQGDFQDKAIQFLIQGGYKVKKSGG